MQVNQINNTNFKQVFAPGYKKYTPIQKEIANDMIQKLESRGYEQELRNKVAGKERHDFLITRKGTKDSLTLYNCNYEFNYKYWQETYFDKLLIGTYNANKEFNMDDVFEARDKKQARTFKGILAATAAFLGLAKAKKFSPKFI